MVALTPPPGTRPRFRFPSSLLLHFQQLGGGIAPNQWVLGVWPVQRGALESWLDREKRAREGAVLSQRLLAGQLARPKRARPDASSSKGAQSQGRWWLVAFGMF